MKKVGVAYHPMLATAKSLVAKLSQVLPSLTDSYWLCSAWEEEKVKAQAPGTDLILSVGGDGTILRVARSSVPWGVPILGINLGKLGFMTELGAEEAVNKLPALLAGEGWIDERTMLQVEFLPASTGDPQTLHALNDMVIGRGAVCRVIYVKAIIDGETLTTYKADGIIVATATGSTGYSLAAGGPVLYPQSAEILLKPISAHLTLPYGLVLPPQVNIELEVSTAHQAVLSIDGQVEFPLLSGDRVKAKRSPYLARFLRVHPPTFFYSSLERKLKGAAAN